jgi:hypothetical protein
MENPGDVSACIIVTYVISFVVLMVYSYAIECNIQLEMRGYLKRKEKIDVSESKSIYCVICMESNCSSHMMVQLDCGHKFHIDCLHKWMIVNPICPICRKEDVLCPSKKNWSQMFSSETPLVLL